VESSEGIPSPRLTRSVEDYLKAIYSLTERHETASTSAVAESLDVSPASVSGMVKRLAREAFLEHVPYRGVRLTEKGSREALRILRRHRVIETYLSVRLGYSWEDVHEEAERLEHAASDTLIDRMAAALEHPQHDPHGAPIPTRSGEIEATDFDTLADAVAGDAYRVRAVRDDDPDRLRYMEALGLLPGVRVVVREREPSDGRLTVQVGGAQGPEEVVGRDVARRIYVSPADEPSGEE